MKFCLIHGENPSHTSDECKVLKSKIGSQDGKTDKGEPSAKRYKTNYKKWENKQDKKEKKEELYAFIQGMVENAVKQKTTKRKATEESDQFSSEAFTKLNVSDSEDSDYEFSI